MRNALLSLLLLAVLPVAAANTLQWQTLAPMPVAVQEIYPAVHQGKIYVAGGLSDKISAEQQQMTAGVQIYDPATDQWQAGPVLPQPRHHAYLVSVAGKLFVFGGFVQANGGRWSASADILQLDEANGVWRKVAQLPKPLTETVAVVLNGNVHFVSGRSPSGPENAQWRDQADVNWHWVFDPQSQQVTAAPPLAQAFNSASGVALNGQFYLVGGRQVGGANLAQLQRITQPPAGERRIGLDPQRQGLALGLNLGVAPQLGRVVAGPGDRLVLQHLEVLDAQPGASRFRCFLSMIHAYIHTSDGCHGQDDRIRRPGGTGAGV